MKSYVGLNPDSRGAAAWRIVISGWLAEQAPMHQARRQSAIPTLRRAFFHLL